MDAGKLRTLHTATWYLFPALPTVFSFPSNHPLRFSEGKKLYCVGKNKMWENRERPCGGGDTK